MNNRERFITTTKYIWCVYVIWFLILIAQQGVAAGTSATLNVFTDPDNAKNYRLRGMVDTKVTFDNPFANKSIYTIKQFTWPNGGYETFGNDCTVESVGVSVKCAGKGGETYYVEISSLDTE